QPKIADLRKKHGKDKQKLTEETMKLYKEHKVNPAMGCLPMLLQFPVLIGLFWALSGLGQSAHITIQAAVKAAKTAVPPWLQPAHHLVSCLANGGANKIASLKAGSLVTVQPACWDRVNHLTVFAKADTLS